VKWCLSAPEKDLKKSLDKFKFQVLYYCSRREKMDWKNTDIIKINEIYKAVDIFEVWLEGFPHKIKVKMLERADGQFEAVTNYLIQNPDQPTPYRSSRQYNTEKEAFNDAIKGLLMFWPSEPEKQEKTKFVLDEEF
jgi:hypothetical protein